MENNMIVVSLEQVKIPKMVENKYKSWITYGEKDDFPLYLQELMNRSALNGAILYSKTSDSCGSGLTYKKKKDSKTDAFLENANKYETLDEVYKKLSYDYNLYGGYCLNVILSRDKKSISEVYHIDFAKIRCAKKDNKGIVNEYYFSNDWTNWRKSENTPIIIPAFSKSSKEESQLIYFKDNKPGVEYYPLPSYVGALAYIEIDFEISNFHLSHIKNGMTPNMLINFNNGIPTADERKVVERQIASKYVGTDNAGRFLLSFSDSKDKAPDVLTLSPAQLDKQFIQLQATVLQNILTGHRITSPMLVGIKTEGQLGGASELDIAFTLYQNSVIEPIKNTLLATINKITAYNGLQELYIEPMKPLEFSWSENILREILTINEMREKINMGPIEVPEIPAPIVPENNITNE